LTHQEVAERKKREKNSFETQTREAIEARKNVEIESDEVQAE
jgi:hypothetical protein